MDKNSTATGSAKSISSRSAGSARIMSGSSRSRPITAALGTPCSMLRACASTTGSLSTYTTRACGQVSSATSCVLPTVGSPAPMSMICRIPASPTR